MRLVKQKCVACRAGSPRVTPEEVAEFRPQVPEWAITQADGIDRLERTFRFDDFASALAFANEVGALAEEEDHHPMLVVEWGRVRVVWWTHKIKGLHRNDFVMAAKTDEAFKSLSGPA